MTKTYTLLGLVPLALLASSCALLRKPEPVVKTVYQPVQVPVAVACLKPSQVPVPPKRVSEATDVPPTLTEMVGWLRATLKLWQDDYGPTVQALLTTCSKL